MAVLNPQKLVEGSYSSATQKSKSARLRRDVLPINTDQQKAVVGLKHRVEIIHGPPGTGKSTTIFHTLTVHLPPQAAAVVTCVCNQAIDAVAEKLRDLQDTGRGGIPMLVLGNPKRVGRTAAEFTMEALEAREEHVVFMDKICERLQRISDGIEHFQLTHMQKLLGASGGRGNKTKVPSFTPTSSRLSPRELEQIPGLRLRTLTRLLEENDREGLYYKPSLRREQTPAELELAWQRLQVAKRKTVNVTDEMRKTHLEVVGRVRAAMVRVAVRSVTFMPAKWAGRTGRTFRWGVADFWEEIKKALEKARRWRGFCRERAPYRILRRTRVFLCTIPSSYRVEQLSADYPEDFPPRLFLALCDEAAATAETYVPQLLQIGVENLVLLGDHKQLQPLVMARNHLEPERKKVSRSLMERMVDCRYPVHLLTIQYRMFDSLCNIVSGLFYHGLLRTAQEKLAQEGACSQYARGAPVQFCWSDYRWYEGVIRRQRPQGDFVIEWEGQLVSCPAQWVRARRTRRAGQPAKRLRWLDLAGQELAETKVGTSYINAGEAAAILNLLLTDPVLKDTTSKIKVIALYKPQVALLETTCADVLAARPNVQFVTVDACQGTEAPHIVLSTVRTKRGQIGFASNPRRLNVAISRAQESLTVVGSGHALGGDRNWAWAYQGFKGSGEVQRLQVQQLRAMPCGAYDKAVAAAEAMAKQRPAKESLQSDWFGAQPSAGAGYSGAGGRGREGVFGGKGRAFV